jgi:hypothetical protein
MQSLPGTPLRDGVGHVQRSGTGIMPKIGAVAVWVVTDRKPKPPFRLRSKVWRRAHRGQRSCRWSSGDAAVSRSHPRGDLLVPAAHGPAPPFPSAALQPASSTAARQDRTSQTTEGGAAPLHYDDHRPVQPGFRLAPGGARDAASGRRVHNPLSTPRRTRG